MQRTWGFNEACLLTECWVPKLALPCGFNAGCLGSGGTCNLRENN